MSIHAARLQLANVPGFADVAAIGNRVSAVVSAPTSLSFVVLGYDASRHAYTVTQKPMRWTFNGPAHVDYPESYASLARDATNTWWISYLREGSVWVLASSNAGGTEWHAPVKIGEATTGWDNAVLFPVPGGLGAMWSLQGESTMFYRFHANNAHPRQWSDTEVLASGPMLAEDHFNVAIAPDETVYVSTMNDRNVVGEKSHILRILDKSGTWHGVPYATLTNQAKPTRAVLLGGGDPWRLYIAQTRLLQGSPVLGEIIQRCSRRGGRIIDEATTPVLAWPGQDFRDATSTRDTLPDQQPWLLLASDKEGRVYEGMLSAGNCEAFAERNGADMTDQEAKALHFLSTSSAGK